MSIILVVAPHPDDETLGCGGTLLRAISEGSTVHWAVASRMTPAAGFGAARIAAREGEIAQIVEAYGFAALHQAPFAATRLDAVPMTERISWLSQVVNDVRPNVLYLPHPNDVHSDHAAVFDAAVACTKGFRHPSVRRVYCYETLSETEFGLRPGMAHFQPNRYVDIAGYLERKIEIMGIYAGETAPPPFPRSPDAMRALATFRGVVASTLAAEAFVVLREIE